MSSSVLQRILGIGLVIMIGAVIVSGAIAMTTPAPAYESVIPEEGIAEEVETEESSDDDSEESSEEKTEAEPEEVVQEPVIASAVEVGEAFDDTSEALLAEESVQEVAEVTAVQEVAEESTEAVVEEEAPEQQSEPTEESAPPASIAKAEEAVHSSPDSSKEEERGEDVVVETQVTVQVNTPQGSRSYPVAVTQSSPVTVEDAMSAAAGLQYTTRRFPGIGKYVESVNGLEEDLNAGLFWIYRVNGVKASLGISSLTVEDGDVISWTYEPSINP